MKNGSFPVSNAAVLAGVGLALFLGAATLLVLGAGTALWSGGSEDSTAVLEAVDPASAPAKAPAAAPATDGVESFVHTGVESAQVSLNAPGNLRVEYSSGAGKAEVEVQKFSDEVVVEVSTDGEFLKIVSRCPSSNDRDCRADVVVAVAPGSALDAYTAVGDIAVTEPNAGVRARADVGTIVLTRPTAPVDAQTGVGDITVEDAGSGRYSLTANVGEVYMSVDDQIESIDASVGTGDIEIVLPDSDARFGIRAVTGLGERRVDVPSNEQGGTPVTAEVGVGDIEVRFA